MVPPAARSPAARFGLALFVAALLVIPLFSVWLLVYDRQSQSRMAETSIAEGWGGPQLLSGPVLVIPYRAVANETVTENGQAVSRSRTVWRELVLAPEQARLETDLAPERRRRSIYEVVVYEASLRGAARFALPPDLPRFGVPVSEVDFPRAELRFEVSDPRGLGADLQVRVDGQPLRLQPGGATAGFFAWIDAERLRAGPLGVTFDFMVRGHGSLGLAPRAGDTLWRISSTWPHPSFRGGFLPGARQVDGDGFRAEYRVGHLALGQSLLTTADPGAPDRASGPVPDLANLEHAPPETTRGIALVSLVQPVDLYSRVNRSAKYGFLFIGFTFLALLLFDVIGGVRVSPVEYLLVGAGLVLFFVLLLALAEVIGFAPAYFLASAAITALLTFYSAAVLKSWRRAGAIAGLLVALYATLYILLGMEEYALLIGSALLFVALAGLMYLTRNLNWGRREGADQA